MRLHGQSTLLRPEQPAPWLPCPGGRESPCSLPQYLPAARVGSVWPSLPSSLRAPGASLPGRLLAVFFQGPQGHALWHCRKTRAERLWSPASFLQSQAHRWGQGGCWRGNGNSGRRAVNLRSAIVGTCLTKGLAELSVKQRGVRESSARGSGVGSGVGGGSRSQEKAVLGI